MQNGHTSAISGLEKGTGMARNKYIRDYRLLESIDERGRIRVDYEYAGEYYRFTAGPAAALRQKRRSLLLCAAGWAAFVLSLLPESRGMRTLYVSLPFAFSALPLGMLTALLLSVKPTDEPMEHPQADKLNNAYPPRALAAALLPAAALAGEGIRFALGPGDMLPGDGVLALGALGLTVCGALAFAGRKALSAGKAA